MFHQYVPPTPALRFPSVAGSAMPKATSDVVRVSFVTNRLQAKALLGPLGPAAVACETSMHASTDGLVGSATAPDIVFIDAAGLPSPIQDIRRVRQCFEGTWITALDVAGDSVGVRVLVAGADAFIPASASPELRAAHIRCAFRHVGFEVANRRIRVGDVIYDREASRVWCAGKAVSFTPVEFSIFDCLFVHAGRAVTRATLDERIGSRSESDGRRGRSLNVYIGYVRRKLSASRSVTIETLRGVGYRLMSDDGG